MCGVRKIISVIISETSNSPFICTHILVEDSLAFDTLKNYFKMMKFIFNYFILFN